MRPDWPAKHCLALTLAGGVTATVLGLSLGCTCPGRAHRLAEIVAGFCLAIELSSYAAMVTGAFAAAHGHLGRKPGG